MKRTKLATHSFLLRCWAERPVHESQAWRYSVQNVRTGERRGFASLDAAMVYVQELIDNGQIIETMPSK